MGQGVWVDSDRLNPEDTIEDVIKNGTMSVGFIGLAECLVALIGKHHGESKEAYDLGYKIIKHMRDLTDKHTVDTGLNFHYSQLQQKVYQVDSLRLIRDYMVLFQV